MLKPTAQVAGLDLPAVIGAALFVAFGGLVVVLRLAPDEGPIGMGRVLTAVALGGLYAVPGILVALSRRRRVLRIAAAVLGFCLIATSFSITPLLVGPSILVLVRLGQSWSPPAPARAALAIGITLVLGFAAFLLLVLAPATRCWTVGGGGGCSADAIAPLRSMAALGALVVLVGASVAVTPRAGDAGVSGR